MSIKMSVFFKKKRYKKVFLTYHTELCKLIQKYKNI